MCQDSLRAVGLTHSPGGVEADAQAVLRQEVVEVVECRSGVLPDHGCVSLDMRCGNRVARLAPGCTSVVSITCLTQRGAPLHASALDKSMFADAACGRRSDP